MNATVTMQNTREIITHDLRDQMSNTDSVGHAAERVLSSNDLALRSHEFCVQVCRLENCS